MSTKALAANEPGRAGPPHPAGTSRVGLLDALKGLAVLCMLTLHSAHGWLHPEARTGIAWGGVRLAGGLAAPLFLFLAGCAVAVAGADRLTPGHLALRGARLVVLGYLLRLWMWVIDGGALWHGRSVPAALLLGTGYLAWLAWLSALREAARADAPGGRRRKRHWTWGLSGTVCVTVGLGWVRGVVPDAWVMLMRVDILQAIGASLLVLAALAGPLDLCNRPARSLWLAASVALASQMLRDWAPGGLPDALAAYLAWWPPGDGSAIALFPLFPWLAYVLAGHGIGRRWISSGQLDPIAVMRWGMAGLLLALVSCETLPHARHALTLAPWATQAARVGYRLGLVLMIAATALAAWRLLPTWLAELGRASLLIYWLHLELAFGIVTRPFARQLGWEAWGVGLVALTLLMWLLAIGRARILRPLLERQAAWPFRFAPFRPGRA